MSPASSPFRNKTPQPLGLDRDLSFIDCSIAQIEEGILSEVPPTPMSDLPSWKFNPRFWSTVLEGEPAPGFKPLQNRTLRFWVAIFNEWRGSSFPKFFDGHDLLRTKVFISDALFLRFVKLFDESGYKRLQSEGLSDKTRSQVKINARELMMSGVILSKLITKKMKLRFTFGLVDTNDEHALDVEQFKEWIRSYIQGLGAAFGVLKDAKTMPCDRTIDKIADRLYQRISDIVGKKVREHCRKGTTHIREQVLQAIRERQAALTDEEQLDAVMAKMKSPVHRQIIKFKKLEKWCLRRYGDPLALPYALALERFCRERQGDAEVDEFNYALESWYLSHKSAASLPQDVSSLPKSVKVLTRPEVILVRRIYDYCIEKETFKLNFKDLESLQVPFTFWKDRMDAGLRAAQNCSSVSSDDRPEFFEFLKLVCPGVKASHLRMFDEWCNQFDNLVEQRIVNDWIHDATGTFQQNSMKEEIPRDELLRLERDFKALDVEDRGFLTWEDLAKAWDMHSATVHEMFKATGVACDTHIDKDDYLALTCPDRYRLPAMVGPAREMFHRLIVDATERVAKDVEKMQELFVLNRPRDGKKDLPHALLPEVDTYLWAQWNDFFSSLDKNHDDSVGIDELLASRLLSRDACEFVVSLLRDGPDSKAFSRASFLRALLEAYGYRRKLEMPSSEASDTFKT